MDTQNVLWVIYPVTWEMSPGRAEKIWSIGVMGPGMVSKVFLIYPPECLTLVFHGLLWDFPNRQATQRGEFSDPAKLLGYYASLG